MATYTCPLCNITYKRYKWFIKHIERYSDDDHKKIFVQGDKILFQGKLAKYVNKKKETS